MNYTLPYYGKKGTIAKIEEDKKFYKVYRYGINKKDKYILEVPKNNLNKELLLNNYYNDLEDYLRLNKDKYKEYSKTKNKKVRGLNILKISAATLENLVSCNAPGAILPR